MKKGALWKERRAAAGIALAASLLCLVLWRLDLFARPEGLSWDWRMRLVAVPSPRGGDIVVVALDQASLDWMEREQGLGWPWPREVYAALVDFCARADAAGLIMDVLFLEPSVYGPEDDIRLGRAVREYGRASLPFAPARAAGSVSRPPDWAKPSPLRLSPNFSPALWRRTEAARFPTAEIASGATLGNAATPADSDGVYRRFLPFTMLGEAAVPNLALAGFFSLTGPARAERQGDTLVLTPADADRTFPPIAIPLDDRGCAVLRFSGPAGSYAHYGAAAVVQSELLLKEGREPVIDPRLLAGKHVLFGFTAPGLFDLRPSPMGGVYSGVEVQATILDNLLGGGFVTPAPLWSFAVPLFAVPLALALCLASGGGLPAQCLVWLAGFVLPPALAFAAARQGVWLPLVPLSAATLLALPVTGLYRHAARERQKRFIEKAFKHYLAPAVVQRIVDSDEDFGLRGEEREVTIFFSDIRGFSSFSEKLSPEQLVRLLNRYFTPMTGIIRKHEGTLDKFIGDAIMAFWNAPEEVSGHSAKALVAALEMHEALDALNPDLERDFGLRLAFGAGLHRGLARVGNMGTQELMNYTVMGDTVNLGSRLEGLCSYYGQRIILSGECMGACGDGPFLFQRLGRERVKGRLRPVDIYTAYAPGARAASEIAASETALRLYEQRDFTGAGRAWAELRAAFPENRLYGLYVDRCRAYLEDPPPPDWDGAYTHTSK